MAKDNIRRVQVIRRKSAAAGSTNQYFIYLSPSVLERARITNGDLVEGIMLRDGEILLKKVN